MIRKTLTGLWSLIVGLKVTGIEFFKPGVTVHFPRKEVTNLGTYRGHIELVARQDDRNQSKCIVCRRCEEICPSGCIRIEMHVPGQEKCRGSQELLLVSNVVLAGSCKKDPISQDTDILRVLDGFYLNYNLCSLCGLCVQNCPVCSLEFSKDVYLAARSRKDFEYELLGRLEARASSSKLKNAA